MSSDAILGLVILCSALSLTVYLVLRSRSIIARITTRRLSTVREIVKDLDNGR
ncbi:hypothetical protein JXA88_10945 [Candidatus Fermentibacteria bacterium]|nr:hypothetical protein [Candidatus Fermentibacteria bacterium]